MNLPLISILRNTMKRLELYYLPPLNYFMSLKVNCQGKFRFFMTK